MATTVWRGYITFGLISIPVRLFRAARAERISFRRVYRENEGEAEPRAPQPKPLRLINRQDPTESETGTLPGSASIVGTAAARAQVQPSDLRPVEHAALRKDTGEALPAASVVKGLEYEKNRYVAIEPEDLKSIAAKTATQMEIQECVKLSEIDPVYFETSYYVLPEEAGGKAYALLYRALQTTGLVALAQFAMHSREHVVVLRPGRTGIVAHTMFYASEVRAEEEYRTDTSLVASKELDLAQTLIQSLAGPFEPEKFRDTYRERLESIISSKLAGQPLAKPKPEPAADVVDITEALRKSLANLKKPAQPARTPRPEPAAHAQKAKPRSAKK